MKINTSTKHNLVDFEDIPYGGTFKEDVEVFLKLSEEMKLEIEGKYNAICLNDATGHFFTGDCKVIKVDTELTVFQ